MKDDISITLTPGERWVIALILSQITGGSFYEEAKSIIGKLPEDIQGTAYNEYVNDFTYGGKK